MVEFSRFCVSCGNISLSESKSKKESRCRSLWRPGRQDSVCNDRVCARALGGQTTEAMAPKPWFRELPRSRRALEKKRHQSRRFAGTFLVPPFLKDQVGRVIGARPALRYVA